MQGGVLTTPTRPFNDPFTAGPVKNHATTKKSYPDGFVLEVEFRFWKDQQPIFPFKLDNPRISEVKHRPTFLGNSGVGIYSWNGNLNGKYLYEVQVTDNAGMMGGVRSLKNENRFVRLDYGGNWMQKGVLKSIVPASILVDERGYYDPAKCIPFKTQMQDGSGDCICAIVAGLPVSYFKDVHYSNPGPPDRGEFPQPKVAVTSPIPNGANLENPLPISGEEDPLLMYYGHRGDYVAGNPATDAYTHFNHSDPEAWNTLKICFLPARYNSQDKKCMNARLTTVVNAGHSYSGGFDGEIKSGTRASRHNNAQDPEPAVYVDGLGDMKIRLLGHWGSTVKFQNIRIRAVGSVGP